MYIPKFNRAPSNHAVAEFIKKYSFATLVCYHESKYFSVHIPLEIEEKNGVVFLTGHVAVSNPMVECIRKNLEVLCIFSEPHAYISSSWYDHVNVPTWNYIAVHLTGQFQEQHDDNLLNSIKQMVDHYENGREDRFNIKDMPDDMLKAHLKGLVGFEINVKSTEANFKLSQNRNDKNYYQVINKLKEEGSPLEKELAEEMLKLR